MSRAALAYAFVQKHPYVLRCPHCGGSVQADAGGIFCGRGHRVDFSRQGTLALSAAAGDERYNRELFLARRKLWEAGCFAPVAEFVAQLLPQGASVVDLGCGEGSLLALLQRQKKAQYAVGVDLSAPAVRAASAFGGEDLLFVKGDIARLPFEEGAFDAAVNMLTPANYGEFARILKKEGLLIKVLPGEAHLQELRGTLGIPDGRTEEPAVLFARQCTLLGEQPLEYTLSPDADLLEAFYSMTPMTAGYEGNRPEKITMSFTVLWGRVKE